MSQLSNRIDEKLAASSFTLFAEPRIFRVDELLHKENKKAYEPEILAIGPYHRNNNQIKTMERHKLRYLQEFLKRRNESSVGRYVEAMEQFEEKARNYYAEAVKLGRDEFVEMMLPDGIFIMELLRNFTSLESRKMNILQSNEIQSILVRDILLFENQLPLFVLIRLLRVANEPNFSVEDALWTCLHKQISFICSSHFIRPPTERDFHHLLGVMHSGMRPSFLDQLDYDIIFRLELIRSATELQEAGIKFKGVFDCDSLMDIDFENGIMIIPRFLIGDDTDIF